jgi:hypothetical protein
MANENQIDQGPAVSPQARQKAQRGGTQARKAAEDVGSAAGAMADKYMGRAEEVWDDCRTCGQAALPISRALCLVPAKERRTIKGSHNCSLFSDDQMHPQGRNS